MGRMVIEVDGNRVAYRDDGGGIFMYLHRGIDERILGTIDEAALGLFTGEVSWRESERRLSLIMELVARAYLQGQRSRDD